MKVYYLLLILLIGCTVTEKPNTIEEVSKIKLTSKEFEHEEMIPAKFTCQGEDINPELIIDDIPKETKSLALIMDDPDSPVGTWVHWLVKDIPITINKIEENSIPGNEVINSFNKVNYGGPCPPSGVHRYFFKLYALDIETFEAESKKEFYDQIEDHKIDETILMGKYTKS